MQEIKCPKCGEVFVVDESGYANIVKQVRDKEFARELKKREEELKTLDLQYEPTNTHRQKKLHHRDHLTRDCQLHKKLAAPHSSIYFFSLASR